MFDTKRCPALQRRFMSLVYCVGFVWQQETSEGPNLNSNGALPIPTLMIPFIYKRMKGEAWCARSGGYDCLPGCKSANSICLLGGVSFGEAWP
eukprot:scaffold94760_cov19-Tisochrysis_lutea.AAC.1